MGFVNWASGFKQDIESAVDELCDRDDTESNYIDEFASKYVTEFNGKVLSIRPATSSSYISNDGNEPYVIDATVDAVQDEISKIWERLNKTVSLVHNCANCGAQLEIEENKPVFHCKYCGSTYVIGSTQIHSHY